MGKSVPYNKADPVNASSAGSLALVQKNPPKAHMMTLCLSLGWAMRMN